MGLLIFLAVIGTITLLGTFAYILPIVFSKLSLVYITTRNRVHSLLEVERRVIDEKSRLRLKKKLDKINQPKNKVEKKAKETIKKESEEVKKDLLSDIEE